MTENQKASLLKRLNLRINDPDHCEVRVDHKLRDDLIMLQQLVVLQQHDIDELKRQDELRRTDGLVLA